MELKEARFKRQITQWVLSKISNIHQSRISLIENGDVASETERNALAKGLGLKVRDIDWPIEYSIPVKLKSNLGI